MRVVFGSLVLTVVAALALPGWALEPPTPEQLQRYREDGTLSRRVLVARELGNHRVAPHLVRAFASRHGGYVQLEQQSALIQGGLPSIGTVQMFALLIEFADDPHTTPATAVDTQLFGPGFFANFPYESLHAFYDRSSYGQLDIQGATLGWYATAYPRAQVAETTAGREALIWEAITHFDAEGHDFSVYDNDGDGQIDNFLVFWTGPIGEWAEFWWGYNTHYQDSSKTVDGVRLGNYSWQWEAPQGSTFTPRVVIHETGHALGLPDYYDYDEAVGPGGGVGGLDQMDGNWGDHNCFSKYMLGWLEPTVVNAGRVAVTLAPASGEPEAAIVMNGAPAEPFGEYFMVQHRSREGNDAELPADGVLIWHVESTLGEFGRFAFNNSYTDHKLLRLMEADGLEEIEQLLGSADAGDFYSTGDELSSDTSPSSNRYDGAPTNVTLSELVSSANGASMTVDLGSGCALFCSTTVPETAWPGQPVLLNSMTEAVNCSGLPSPEWVAGDGSGRAVTVWQHLYSGMGPYHWSFVTTLGDASCPRSGTVLVCEDERCWQWQARSAMMSPRWIFDAVVLEDGRVLVGGSGGPPEVYDPLSDSWRAVGPTNGAYDGATLTRLEDGRVLMAGNAYPGETAAELYDPNTDTWTVTDQPAWTRSYHAAELLDDGSVLIAGGVVSGQSGVAAAERFDPVTEQWRPAGVLSVGEVLPTLTELSDGRVVLVSLNACEIYDPSSNQWYRSSGPMNPRLYHTAARLPNGRVVVVGGLYSSTAEVFYPTSGTWLPAATPEEHRFGAPAVTLPSGKILLAGGGGQNLETTLTSAELYDPDSGSWRRVRNLSGSRAFQAMVVLPSGEVLAIGGAVGRNGTFQEVVGTAERFAPPELESRRQPRVGEGRGTP